MHLKVSLTVFAATLWSAAAAASQLRPPVLPLAVRNPYLSLWYNARTEPWKNWPMFWTGEEIGLSVIARSPSKSKVYPLVGRTSDSLLPVAAGSGYNYSEPVFNGFQFDAHSTTLSYSLGTTTQVKLYFSSPITGDSIMRQGLPASYLEVKVSGSEDLEVYVDVNGMWLTHDTNATIQWDRQNSSTLQSWSISRQTQLLFTENSDRAEWGTLYFTAPAEDDVSYQSAGSESLRKWFAANGTLQNTSSNSFRSSTDNEPVFAYSKLFSLSSGKAGSDSVLFTLAFSQDPIVQFAGKDGYLARRPLWTQYFNSAAEMISFHYEDYATVSAIASVFSKKLAAEAAALVSSTYADIVALSARQTLGGTYFSGTPTDPILNLKEISSDGNFQTVDVMFPALPFFLYLNASWVSYLLEPLLENQLAGLYPNKYSMHDLGSHFPNATGHPDGKDEQMPLEECGNMLVMALAYSQSLNSTTAAQNWINKDGRYVLWKQWTQFLVDESLVPANQLSTDDFAGRLENQTNLAVKGIIGIRAMAELSAFMGEDQDAKQYRLIADSYMPQWKEYALSRDGTHTKLAYNWQGSWGSLYNAYADSLLCFHVAEPPFLPHDIYTKQSKWYDLVHQRYGLPLDSRHIYTKSDWELWTAAISSEGTRATIVEAMGSWVNETTTDRPFTDLYDSNTGGWPGINFMARPVVGGHFSVLALDKACGGKGFEGLKQIFTDVQGEEEL